MIQPELEPVMAYLRVCREISGLTSQNGWIDNDTLRLDVLERGEGWLLAALSFEEVIVEGAGCIAGRVPCYGRIKVYLDPAGGVRALELP